MHPQRGGEYENGESFSKLKGYSNKTHWSVFEKLLYKDSEINLSQSKLNRLLYYYLRFVVVKKKNKSS